MTVKIETADDTLTIRYDQEADAAYIRVRSGKVARSQEYAPGFITLDFNSKGELLGIEALHPGKLALLFSEKLPELARRYQVPALKRLHPELLPRLVAA